MPGRPGVSLRTFGKLEDELLSVAKRLSNRQLLELADDFHAMLRERRSRLNTPAAAPPFMGINDNQRPPDRL